MKVITWFGVIMLTLLSIYSDVTTEAQVNDEVILKELLVKQNQAWRERDFDTIKDIWAQKPYILRVSATNVHMGWDSIGANYKRVIENSIKQNPEYKVPPKPTFDNHHFLLRDDIAMVSFDQTEEYPVGNQNYTWKSIQIRGFENISDDWQMIFQYTASANFTDENEEETYVRNLAIQLFNREQKQKTKDLLQLMTDWYPESSRVRRDLGYTLLDLGDTTRAVKYLKEAVAMNDGLDNVKDMLKQLTTN